MSRWTLHRYSDRRGLVALVKQRGKAYVPYQSGKLGSGTSFGQYVAAYQSHTLVCMKLVVYILRLPYPWAGGNGWEGPAKKSPPTRGTTESPHQTYLRSIPGSQVRRVHGALLEEGFTEVTNAWTKEALACPIPPDSQRKAGIRPEPILILEGCISPRQREVPEILDLGFLHGFLRSCESGVEQVRVRRVAFGRGSRGSRLTGVEGSESKHLQELAGCDRKRVCARPRFGRCEGLARHSFEPTRRVHAVMFSDRLCLAVYHVRPRHPLRLVASAADDCRIAAGCGGGAQEPPR